MDLYGLDGSTLSSLFTGVIALWIYTNWRGQKRAEIFSTEAKSLLLLIADYRSQLMSTYVKIMACEHDSQEYKKLKNIERNLRNYDTFFDELNNQKPNQRSIFGSEVNLFSNEVKNALQGLNESVHSKNHPKHEKNSFNNIIQRFDENRIIAQKKSELFKFFNYGK